MTTFTKEQLKEWASRLIDETRSDISISRTDAHAESYHAQLELLEIAMAALIAEPAAWMAIHHAEDVEDEALYATHYALEAFLSNVGWHPALTETAQLYRLPMIEGLK